MSGPGGEAPFGGDHVYAGVYYAIVTKNDDTEGSGRVKVRFPWLPEGTRDQTFWAPLAVPMCGDSFGTYVVPEVEDTVTVVFLSGDIRYPVVVGGIWSKEDPPPEDNADGNNDFRVIKSRSGHRLLFDDSDGKKVVLTDKGDKNLVGCGSFSKGGSSDKNEFQIPCSPSTSSESSKGVGASALSGTLEVYAGGDIEVNAPDIEIVSTKESDVIAGSNVSSSAGSKTTFFGAKPSAFQGGGVKIN